MADTVNMKKSLALLVLLSFFSMGMVGALSVVPHVHGDDFTHSKHASCPIHQIGAHGIQAVINGFASTLAFSFVFYLFVFANQPIVPFLVRLFSVRAPPAHL